MRAGVTDVLGVLAFSALPFATVQALADSDFGKKLRVKHAKLFVLRILSTSGRNMSREGQETK